jgi:hypothetical protein
MITVGNFAQNAWERKKSSTMARSTYSELRNATQVGQWAHNLTSGLTGYGAAGGNVLGHEDLNEGR